MLKKTLFVIAAALASTLLFSVSCGKKNPADSGGNASAISAESDAAEAIAGAMGENTGGLMDSIGDILEISSGTSFQGLGKADARFLARDGEDSDPVYDNQTGRWMITFTREYGSPSGVRYGFITRTVTVRFVNHSLNSQRRFIMNGDTAITIELSILSGSGRHKTPRLSQRLNFIGAALVATGTNTGTVTISGTYRRSASDTITTARSRRTMDYTLNIDPVDLQGPRGDRGRLVETVSGTLTGSLTGHVTFETGERYNEKDITREFSIELIDSPVLKIRGRKYAFDLKEGELNE
jgi:hypothetical protein